MRFDGVVIRSDGNSTRWVNGQPQVGASGVAGLKPGQIRADGKVYEPYQVLRPSPAPAIDQGTHTMKQARGFTLIELAIVLVIITILIGGLAVPLSAQIQARRIAETRTRHGGSAGRPDRLCDEPHIPHPTLPGEIRHYLPCPDANNDGLEDARNALGNAPTSAPGCPGSPWA